MPHGEGAEPVAQVRIVTGEFAEQRATDAIEPELRVAHQLQMQIRRRAGVLPLQRIEQAIGSSLNFLPPVAAKSCAST